MLVPAQQFAIVLLTNGDLGAQLTGELFTRGWALRHFTGLSNTPARPRRLSASQLAEYEGCYTAESITTDNHGEFFEVQLSSLTESTLQLTVAGLPKSEAVLTFYTDDYVIDRSSEARSNFLRDASGAVVWLRHGGRLYRPIGSQPQEPVAAPSNDELLPDYD